MKYKIYKLVYDNQVIYVGSTTMKKLCQRKAVGYPKIEKEIWKTSKIILIEETYDKTKEQFWIDYYKDMNCLLYNKNSAISTNKSEYDKKRYSDNKEYRKKLYLSNKNYRKEYMKEYYKKSKKPST